MRQPTTSTNSLERGHGKLGIEGGEGTLMQFLA